MSWRSREDRGEKTAFREKNLHYESTTQEGLRFGDARPGSSPLTVPRAASRHDCPAPASPTTTTDSGPAANGAPAASDAGSRERAIAAAAVEFGVPRRCWRRCRTRRPGGTLTRAQHHRRLRADAPRRASLTTTAERRGLGGPVVATSPEPPAADTLGRAAATGERREGSSCSVSKGSCVALAARTALSTLGAGLPISRRRP